MNSTKDMQNQESIIQTVQLNKEQFSCLEHFLDVEADVIIVESKKAFYDLMFCFDEIDKEVFYQIAPEYIRFVKI